MMEPIEAALERIATLLQQQIDQAEAWMAEVRVRDAEIKAADEAWKEEMRVSVREHDRIEQERLAIDRENAKQLADGHTVTVIHQFVHNEETP